MAHKNSNGMIIVFVAAAAVAIVLLFFAMSWSNQKNKWIATGDQNPADRLDDVVAEFGKPDLYDPGEGGVAIWKKETLQSRVDTVTGEVSCFDRIEIRDEQISHADPAAHFDFLYTWYELDIPQELVPAVLGLSDSVTYDPLKKLVRARCHDMIPNVVTLSLAREIATGNLSPEEAYAEYGPRIMEMMESAENGDRREYAEAVQMLCQN